DDYKKGVITKDILTAILKLIQSFVWRRFIVGLPTNALNKIFMTLYSEVDKDEYVNSLEVALARKRGAQRFPVNKDIEAALFEKDVYNIQSKNRMYFLEMLENHKNREFVSVDNPNITIEHIFPQTPDEKWYGQLPPEEIDAFSEKYLNTISNLTLSGNNGSLSNKPFQEKKSMNKDGKEQGYNYSRLWLNQYLRQIDSWNLEALKTRYKLLLERFFQIWTYPEVDVDEEFDTSSEFPIGNAPEPRNRKLEYFIFRDEKIIEDEVSKMYYHVIKSLFDENPSAFNHDEIKSLIQLTTNAAEARSPYQISPSYYIESNIDSNTKFRRLKVLLTKFDCEEDLLVKFADDGFEEESEELSADYWLRRSGPEGMAIVNQCAELLREIDKSIMLTYKVGYIGVNVSGKPRNFVLFNPRSEFVRVNIKVSNGDDWIEKMKKMKIHFLSTGKRSGRLKFRIVQGDLSEKSLFISQIFADAYQSWDK
ncbi:MAG: HNH endonuclease, partial [Cyclobacteriaceae bacterium]|nr:HNH endonuclease [Cyclobacteriaceae bacterium]